MKILTRISLTVIPFVLLLAGCFSTGEVKEENPDAATQEVAVEPEVTPMVDSTPTDQTTEVVEQEVEDPMLQRRTVYFDFDSSTVRDEALAVIRAHSTFLVNNPNKTFTLEGHADERGTREYNLALGERRADSVRRLMLANGVSASQINVISYGEERPAKLGHNDDAWDANRRAELVYDDQ